MEIFNDFQISGIPKIIFGQGKFKDLASYIKEFGTTVCILTGGSSLHNSGKLDTLISQLKTSQITYYIESIKGEPTPTLIDAIVKKYLSKKISCVVGIGGGSVLDAGKAISAMLLEDKSILSFLESIGTMKPSGKKIPYIAVPTTSGTGSEATKNAVLCDVGLQGYKKSLRHDNYIPNIALIDPELMISCPRNITASCALDTLSQLIESYTSNKSNPFTESLSHTGILYCIESYMPLLGSDSNSLEYRSKMAYASLVSGICLSHAGLGTVHGIAGSIGGYFSIPHGIICGKLLLPVTKKIIEKLTVHNDFISLEKFVNLGKLCTQVHNKDLDFYCASLLTFITQCTIEASLPQLRIYGVSPNDSKRLISTSDNKNSPIQLSKEEMEKIVIDII